MTKTGPLLPIDKFFTACLNLELPGLEKVREAVQEEDFEGAKAAFAAYVRTSLRPDVFFTIPYEIPENNYTRPNESIREAAERICENKLISCGTECDFGDKVDWFHNPTYNQYKEWTWQLSRHNEWKLLGHVYRETGDERYAQHFARLFESWVRQAICPPEETIGYETLCWRTIECGIRMGANWPYTLHAFCRSPAFTDELLVDWYRSVYEHGMRLRHRHVTGNWLIMEMNGLAQIGILYPVFKESAGWLEYAFKMLGEELGRQIYPDGFQYELSTGYHDVVINNYHRLIRTARAYGVPVPESFLPVLERASEIDVKLMMPDGRLPDINDGGWHASKKLLEKKAEELFPQNEVFRWVVSDKKEGKAPDYRSIALPYAGFLAMRTGWEPDAVWGLFDTAPFGKAHQHEDKLNLLVFGRGKVLLTEGGNYAYDTSEMRRYVLSTRSHNTVRVDGFDQNRREGYSWQEEEIRKESGMRWRIEEDFDFGEGVYDEGYGPTQDRAISHRRSVYFFKRPPKGLSPFFAVVDRFTGEGEHRFETLWHLGDEKASLQAGKITAPNVTLLSSRAQDGVELVLGAVSPEWQGWVSAGSGRQGAYSAIPTVRQSVTARRAVTIIFPCEEGSCPIERVEASGNEEDQRFTLRLLDGSELVFEEPAFQ